MGNQRGKPTTSAGAEGSSPEHAMASRQETDGVLDQCKGKAEAHILNLKYSNSIL